MNRLGSCWFVVVLLVGVGLPLVPVFAIADAGTVAVAPHGSSVTRAGIALRVVTIRHRDSTLLTPGATFEEVALQVVNTRPQQYTLYATDFLLLNAAAQVYDESAADAALAHQIVPTQVVPPGHTITATVAFVVSARDHLTALQWAYHRTDPGVTGIDPAAEQVLVLLPGVTHPPMPAGPIGSLTLYRVTVKADLHPPRPLADPTKRLWIASVSLRNQSAQPLYYSAGSFALLDAHGLFHVPVALDPSLQPLPAEGWLAPGHAVSGQVAARFPAGVKPVAVRWTSLQFGPPLVDWVILLPATLQPVPTARPAPHPAASTHIYTVLEALQDLDQHPQEVLGHTIHVRGVALWSTQTGLMLVDTRLVQSLPHGLSLDQAAIQVLIQSRTLHLVPILFLQSPHASTYGRDLTPRIYRIDLHPQPCHTDSVCPQGALLGT